jgi:hypothetical protein
VVENYLPQGKIAGTGHCYTLSVKAGWTAPCLVETRQAIAGKMQAVQHQEPRCEPPVSLVFRVAAFVLALPFACWAPGFDVVFAPGRLSFLFFLLGINDIKLIFTCRHGLTASHKNKKFSSSTACCSLARRV